MESESRKLENEAAAFWALIDTLSNLTSPKARRIQLREALSTKKFLKKWLRVLYQEEGLEFITHAKELGASFPKEVRLILKGKYHYDIFEDLGIDRINRALDLAGLKQFGPKRATDILQQRTLPDSNIDHLELWDHPGDKNHSIGRIFIGGIPAVQVTCLKANAVGFMLALKKMMPVYYIES